jgi:opacity protein-like surface antigen
MPACAFRKTISSVGGVIHSQCRISSAVALVGPKSTPPSTGKVGGGWAEDRASLSLPNGTSWTGSSTIGGWVAGGGLEYAFKPNWTVKLEYDYFGLGNLDGIHRTHRQLESRYPDDHNGCEL